ncbi:MAG: STAS domain-containing protein [PVC group bacterium]
MIECTYHPETRTLLCRFSGRMDGANSEEVEKVIRGNISAIPGDEPAADSDAGLNIVFDLAGVDYVSSVFFRVCIATARKAKEGGFSIINTGPFVNKIFKTAGLEEILNVS